MNKIISIKIISGEGISQYLFDDGITLADMEQAIGQPLPLEFLDQYNSDRDAVTKFSQLPDWMKTWTAEQAAQYVHDNVLNGFERANVDTYVASLPNTVAGVKTGMVQIGYALVDIRNMLSIIARLLIYLRDLILKYKT